MSDASIAKGFCYFLGDIIIFEFYFNLKFMQAFSHPPPAQTLKPPEGGFSVSWWPGAESNRAEGMSDPVEDYFQLRFNLL